MAEQKPIISIDHVSMRFNLAKEKHESLKEYFVVPTPHRHPFQRMCVRSSIAFYGNFNLDMGRSPGFGSADTDYMRPLQTWFPFDSTP